MGCGASKGGPSEGDAPKPKAAEKAKSEAKAPTAAGATKQAAAEGAPAAAQKRHVGARRQTQTQRRVAISAEISSIGDVPKTVYQKSDEDKERIRDALQKHPLFESLQAELISDIVDAMQERKVATNEAVITQGAAAHARTPPAYRRSGSRGARGSAFCRHC